VPWLAILALTCLLGAVIHQLGHYLAGTLFKQRLQRVVVGPIEMARGARGWTIRLVRMRFGGMVEQAPSSFARLRLQEAACAAGGPLASLLSGLAFVFLALHSHRPPAFWLWAFSVGCSLVGVLSLVPIQWAMGDSDGYKLRQAIRRGTPFEWTARSHATALRVRDYPRDLVLRFADGPTDPGYRRASYYLAYIHFLDSGDSEKAGQYLDRLMADWTAGDAPEYALEAAYFYALHANDLNTARKWLALEARDVEPWVRLRAQAAIERAANNQEKARMLIDEALTALRSAPACGAYEYEIDRLEAL